MVEGPGIGLSRRFYTQLVQPMLGRAFPELLHAAARIGIGSEVLGYDTALSADHDYGPNVQILIGEAEFAEMAPRVLEAFDRHLPERFEGHLVRYPTVVRPRPMGSESLAAGSSHGVELYTLAGWCERFFGRQFDEELTPLEWLSYPEHLYLMVTAGAVFRDDLGALTALRARLAYFPRDVWLYKLAAQWGRVAEERAYVGRAGELGDELGSRVTAARMVHNLMRLGLLIERQYVPYGKWFGTAFARLDCAQGMTPLLDGVLDAPDWQAREAALIEAASRLAALQLERQIPGAIPAVEGKLHQRPYRFVDSVAIADSLRSAISSDFLRQLPGFGGADQFLAGFVLAVPKWSSAAARALYESE